MSPFQYALQLLTRFPVVSADVKIDDDDYKVAATQALYYLPLVGLMIGGLLLLIYAIMIWFGFAQMVVAALLVVALAAITGALHLDGLADSADAWLGGFGDKDKTLAIMKDPYSGPAGVVALVSVLLIKFSALYTLVSNGEVLWLVFAPVIARALAMLLFAETPYVRSGGMGEAFSDPKHKRVILMQLAGIAVLALLIMGWQSVWVMAMVLSVTYGARALMIQRIGGTTGDTAGALIEVLECVVLVVAVA